jgi:superfamily II DNA helicase RecQ
MIVSPEQFFRDPTSGAIPKLLGLLNANHAFIRSIKHVYIDEGHELFFSGIDRHGIPAFRPSYGNLDKILPKLPNKTTVHVLSATLPLHVIQVIEAKLFRNREKTHIQLPLNRQNIVYTTRTITDLGDYKNLAFLVSRQNPDSRPSGVIVFFESSMRADDAATYLNRSFRALHPTYKITQIAASYHAGLSSTHLTRIFQQFCGTHVSKQTIDILCATSCGATV